MNASVQLSRIEGILNQTLGPLYCHCSLLKDSSMLICVHEPVGNTCCLMVAGISSNTFRSEDRIHRLAESLQNDLAVVRSIS